MEFNKVDVLVNVVKMMLASKDVQEIILGRQKGKTTLLKNFVHILASESPVPVKVLLLAEHASLLPQFTELKELVGANSNIELTVDITSQFVNSITTVDPEANTNENFYIFVDGYNSVIARLIANTYAMANNKFNMVNKDTSVKPTPPKILTFKKPNQETV